MKPTIFTAMKNRSIMHRSVIIMKSVVSCLLNMHKRWTIIEHGWEEVPVLAKRLVGNWLQTIM